MVVMAAWVIRFVMRKLRPEYSSRYSGEYPEEEGLQPWEDPDLMDWEDKE